MTVAPGRHGDGVLRCIETPTSVSVIWMGPKLGRGNASAESMGVWWWVSRVVVNPPALRGQGIGSAMMRELLAGVQRQGARELRVQPGGYGGDIDRQARFYARHGFVETYGEEGMVWRPR